MAVESRRVHATYSDDMALDLTIPTHPVVIWNVDSAKPKNAYARRLAEKEYLETMDALEPAVPDPNADADAQALIVTANAALADRKERALIALRNYRGMANVEAINQDMEDMQLMASGQSGVNAMQADSDAMDIIAPPAFGHVVALTATIRKNFLATINNATYGGTKDSIHDSNVLTMILSGLKSIIESEHLSEEAASQLGMAVFRQDALDIYMIHRKRVNGFVTFWSLIQTLSKTQISPTQAIQRISKLKQTKIPSQAINGVIAEIIRLNHFTLPTNQSKQERDEQYTTSILRDMRDLVTCQFPSFTNQVTLKEREAKAALEARKATLRSNGDYIAAEAIKDDPIGNLVQAMISILHVESEGSRIEFSDLDSAMSPRKNVQKFEKKSSPRFSSIRQEQRYQPPLNTTPQQNRQNPRLRGVGFANKPYPPCRQCGKGHPDGCNRYERIASFPCKKCTERKQTLFHYAEDCNQLIGYAAFANRNNQPQAGRGAYNQPNRQFGNPRQNNNNNNRSSNRGQFRQPNGPRGTFGSTRNFARQGAQPNRQQPPRISAVDAKKMQKNAPKQGSSNSGNFNTRH